MKLFIRNLAVSVAMLLSVHAGFAGTVQRPVTPDPSDEACALLAYLYDVQGNLVLAGQHGAQETVYVHECTGRYPALLGQDLIHESRNSQVIDNAIRWWKAGGIPTLMWHWGAPGKGPGYENSKKEIDIERCFQEGTPEYNALWDDFKRIADHLTVLRDAGVPVLWRPMHECDGNWFWYGKGTGEQFCRVWRLMFDYFAKERHLNNLIWVLCHSGEPKAEFNPGEGYYDIAGADSYNTERIREEMYRKVRAIHGEGIPVPYHECGTIPDPDLCAAAGVDWSWWMLWSGEHAKAHDRDELRRLYAHDKVVTLDELPDIMSFLPKDAASSRTRGLGIYPGSPEEYAGPQIRPASDCGYRNLAFRRTAFHSSSYDYGLTAQLVTDGIVHDGQAPWLEVLVDGKPVSKQAREYLLDEKNGTKQKLSGDRPVLEFRFHGMPVDADRIEVKGKDGNRDLDPDAVRWKVSRDRMVFTGRFPKSKSGGFELSAVEFYKGEELLDVLPSLHFHSSWKSEGTANEWIYIDLGAVSSFDRMEFIWENAPASGMIQVSDDAETWTDICPVWNAEGAGGKGRYVRALLDKTADGRPFELKEWKVFGCGGVVAVHDAAPCRNGSAQYLTRGGWKLQRESEINASGEELSQSGYDDSQWMPATVPGTVFASYLNAGALPDPNIADWQYQSSESFFRSEFWYRNVFTASPDTPRQFLNMDGINWKAEAYLNGKFIGRIDGAFREGKFDVTGILAEGENCLAVRIIPNEHFGAIKEKDEFSTIGNGGILGADNPTLHATIGWDWQPTVKGRSAGILDDVWISYTGDVTLEDPFVRTLLPLPDTSRTDILTEVTLVNHSDRPVRGVLRGSFGNLSFESPQTIGAGECKIVCADTLHMDNPQLWWPNNYGKPHLYPVSLSFEIDGKESDRKEFQSGVRQMWVSFDKVDGSADGDLKRLNLYVNGKRLTAFGGNWGLSEHLLNYRGREYDIAVRNHADMNFTMIRNWVGQIYDKEFYDACDRHGIMVWQDFWLANPADGPDPYDVERFNETARETVRRLRNHPSIAIYVGRNEGNPPAEIDSYLAEMTAREHPGIYYLSNSADSPVSGRGPYRALPVKEYYKLFGLEKLHSERGMPCVMNIENMTRSFGKDAIDPVSTLTHPNVMYGHHDYALGNVPGASSAQRTDTFNNLMAEAFGEPEDAEEFTRWSQWLTYNGYRAIFEARSAHRRGMLLWMSHPSWPSMVWQTYDYYFEPTPAYFACRKACEPMHIQWNPLTNEVEAVSWYASEEKDLVVNAEILNLDGSVAWQKETGIDLGADRTVSCFALEFPDSLSDVFFVRLKLTDRNGRTLSENFYWEGRQEGNWKALRNVPQTRLDVSASEAGSGDERVIKMEVTNSGKSPALMLRVKVTDSVTGDLILPAWYSDNYFFMMPGESRTLTVRVREEDRTGDPVISISGLNVCGTHP